MALAKLQLQALLVFALASPSWASAASSTGFRLQADSLDTSGGLSTSSNYSVNACIGSAIVGSSASGSYKLDAGCAPLVSVVALAAPVNGVCSTPAPSIFAPDAASLCSAGVAGAVSAGASGWQWSCAGTNGGSTASCSSNYVDTASGSGPGRAVLGGTAGWVVDPAQTGFINGAGLAALPQGYQFPHGLFKVRLINGPAGTGATVTLTYPSALPPGTVYWKYGPTSSHATPHWYVYPGAVVSGSTITLSLLDGADGDADLLANSVITDPGGPGVPDPTANPIPTLSQWMLMGLALLVTFITFVDSRRLRHVR